MTPEYVLRHGIATDEDAKRAVREIDNMTSAKEFAESGYDQPAKGILFADWNYFDKRTLDILERMGYECEWSDEWSNCDGCGKAVRTSPDHCAWQPYYVVSDGGLVCLNCMDWESTLEDEYEDNANKAVFNACDPSKYGYRRVSEDGEFESGFHLGQDDKPKEILKRLHAAGVKRVVFRIPETSQFYIRFETWAKVEEVEEYDENDMIVR